MAVKKDERYATLLNLLAAVQKKMPPPLRGKERILDILYDEGPLSVKGIITIMDIQCGSASEIINRLEDLGLVKKQLGIKDKRERVISLTESGKRHVEESRVTFRETKQSANPIYALTPDEVETMIKLLNKILQK